MLVVAFGFFATLVVAWLIAPNGASPEAPATTAHSR